MKKIIRINTTTIPQKIELKSKNGSKLFIYGNKVLRIYKTISEAKKKQRDNEKLYYDAYKQGWYLAESSIKDAREQQEKEMERFKYKNHI